MIDPARRLTRRRLVKLSNRLPELLSSEEREEIPFLEDHQLWLNARGGG